MILQTYLFSGAARAKFNEEMVPPALGRVLGMGKAHGSVPNI